MKKTSNTEIYNCSSCGYGTCEAMAVAIHNNLNRKENCHHYKGQVITEVAVGLSNAMNEMTQLNETINGMMGELAEMSQLLKKDFSALNQRVDKDKQLINEFDDIASTISNIAYKTDILAINAAIEAARAGNAGRGFGIVAEEVKKLSIQSSDETEKIRPRLKQIEMLFQDISKNLAVAMPHFEKTNYLTSEVSGLITQTNEIQLDKLKQIGLEFQGLVKTSESDFELELRQIGNEN